MTQKLADALRLEVRTSQELLTKWMSASAPPTQKAISVFLDDTLVGSNLNVRITRSLFPAQFETFTKLHKAALVIGKLELTPSQLPWAFGYPDANGNATVPWLDLNALPLTPNASASPLFQAWEHLVQVIALRGGLPRGAALLPGLIEMTQDPAATPDMILERISSHTRWDLDDLKFLVGADGFNLTFPDDYRNEQALARLAASFALLKRLGMTAQTARALANAEVAEGNARAARQAVRSKYDEAQWLTLAKPLRDPLREKQRAALVAYLVTHPDRSKTQPLWRDINDLYAHFLIDVEMTPCMLTSRIKQAIGSVQLFVQRCLMNLEPEVTASADDRRRMAAVEVDEELPRVGGQPQGLPLPGELDRAGAARRQVAVLQGAGERAAPERRHDGDGRGGVPRLPREARRGGAARDRRHVPPGRSTVATKSSTSCTCSAAPAARRTSTIYRRRVDSAHWTAWEKVDLDIEGDHLIPVVWNRRLYLFWPSSPRSSERGGHAMPGQGEQVGQRATVLGDPTCLERVQGQQVARQRRFRAVVSLESFERAKTAVSEESSLAKASPRAVAWSSCYTVQHSSSLDRTSAYFVGDFALPVAKVNQPAVLALEIWPSLIAHCPRPSGRRVRAHECSTRRLSGRLDCVLFDDVARPYFILRHENLISTVLEWYSRARSNCFHLTKTEQVSSSITSFFFHDRHENLFRRRRAMLDRQGGGTSNLSNLHTFLGVAME